MTSEQYSLIKNYRSFEIKSYLQEYLILFDRRNKITTIEYGHSKFILLENIKNGFYDNF